MVFSLLCRETVLSNKHEMNIDSSLCELCSKLIVPVFFDIDNNNTNNNAANSNDNLSCMNENELISCMIEVYAFTQFTKSVFWIAFCNLLIDPSHSNSLMT